MKKIMSLFVLSLLFCSGFIKAGNPVKWGVVAGMNNSTLDVGLLESKIGFHVGVKTEICLPTISNGVYIDAAALLSLKGVKELVIGDTDNSDCINPYYLEVPVHIGYKCNINDKFALFGNAGPYLAYGLFGNNNGDDVFGDNWKRFDMGLGFRAGVEFKKYQFAFGYDWGMTSVDSEYSAHNRNLTISAAYMF